MAIVNDDIILLSDVENALVPYREQLKQAGYSEMQQKIALADQRPLLLEQLITEKVTDQQVKRFGIQISEAEVDATIQRIQEMNGLSDERLRQKIELEGLDYDTYRKQMKERLLRTKLMNREVNAKIVVTEEDVRAYYEKHREEYTGQTQYHLRRILVKHTDNAARERVDRIYQRLRAGEDFASLAAIHSDGQNAADGGDLGTYEVRLLAPAIQQALDGLQKGQFSRIVDTEQGYQILYIEDIIHSGGKTLVEARSEIQDKIYSEIVEQKFKAWLKDLRDKAHVKIMD